MSLIHWSFENGRLIARDAGQRLLWSARAEEQIGMELAELLNQAPRLSQELMSPLPPGTRPPAADSPDVN